MGHRAFMGLGVAALLAGAVTSIPVQSVRAQGIGFSTPTVMDPMESVGEPTIVQSPAADNTVYASGPWGTGTQRSIWNASADLGQTFRLTQQCPPTSGEVSGPCPAPTAVTGTANPPGGGDTDQRLDHTGKDYFADLWALACDRVAVTTNDGHSARQFAYGCNNPSAKPSSRPDGSDRQWLDVFDPALTGVTSTAKDAALAPLTYMEYNNLQTTQTGCSYWVKSRDGLHYSPANNDNGNFGCDGYPSVDQVTGKVFEASGCTVGGTPSLCLNIGTPHANGTLCFLDDNGAETIGGNTTHCPNGGGLITVASGLAGDPDNLFTVSSMDTGRNLHITYAIAGAVSGTTSTYQVFTTVASAASGWRTWATPVQLSGLTASNGQTDGNVNVFPWMVSGGPGRSDSVWYGTNTFVDPSTNAGQAWNVYMAQAVWPVDGSNQVTLAPPTVERVQVSPHPNHYNSICLLGTGCITAQGDRNLADFFTVTIDHSGAAEVEYDDTSNGLEQAGFSPGNGLFDHAGAPVVTIARQNAGPGLYGSDVSSRPYDPAGATATGQGDPNGDARYPVIGGNNIPALDLVSGKTSGQADTVALSSDNSTLTVTLNVADVNSEAVQDAIQAIPGAAHLQYVTRWIQCPSNEYDPTNPNDCKIYYAMAETDASGNVEYYGGAADSIDLCSVSACDPHVEIYPESPASNPALTGNLETGSTTCPANPSYKNPCTITISVKASDVGSPTSSTLLEEVGSYSFASAYLQSQLTNPQAESDLLPLEVDGVCCFDYQASSPSAQRAPLTAALLVAGPALLVAGIVRRRRERGGSRAPGL